MQKSEPKEPHTLPFLVLGNKSDIEEGQRKINKEEAAKYCAENGYIFYETSARDNINIEEAFRNLVVKVIERQDRLNTKILGGEVDPQSTATGERRQSAVANNASRRMTRSTKTRVVLNDKADNSNANGQKKSEACCKN